ALLEGRQKIEVFGAAVAAEAVAEVEELVEARAMVALEVQLVRQEDDIGEYIVVVGEPDIFVQECAGDFLGEGASGVALHAGPIGAAGQAGPALAYAARELEVLDEGARRGKGEAVDVAAGRLEHAGVEEQVFVGEHADALQDRGIVRIAHDLIMIALR